MNETSGTSNIQLTLFGSTTSPESEAGNMPSSSPAGPKTERSGLGAVLASLSQSRASAKRIKTKEIYGPLFFVSSPSAGLQSSLASRLMARLPTGGSTEFAMTWRELVTPSGRPYCQLAVSAHRTSGSASIGWPSPVTEEHRNTRAHGNTKAGESLDHAAKMAGWSTPQSHDGTGARGAGFELTDHHHRPHDLVAESQLAGWPSPNAHDGHRPGYEDDESTQGSNLRRDVRRWLAPQPPDGATTDPGAVAGWNSPRATDGSNGGPNQSGGALSHDVQLSGWATPTAKVDSGSRNTPNSKAHKGYSLTDQVRGDLGRGRLAAWATPMVDDAKNLTRKAGTFKDSSLTRMVVTGWSTPGACDARPHDTEDTAGQDYPSQNQNWIGRQAQSTAQTGNGGGYRLNPAFSLWLIAGDSVTPVLIETCPRGLVSSREPGTRSLFRSPQNSSGR